MGLDDGQIQRCKAHLVAQGYSQKSDVDYDEDFSPVLKYSSMTMKKWSSLNNSNISLDF